MSTLNACKFKLTMALLFSHSVFYLLPIAALACLVIVQLTGHFPKVTWSKWNCW